MPRKVGRRTRLLNRQQRSPFETSLLKDSYADVTVQSKSRLLAKFGQWLGRSGLSVTNFDEHLIGTFIKEKQRVRRGDLKTLKQFLDHLRKRDVVPSQKLVCDKSALTEILGRYEQQFALGAWARHSHNH